MIQQHDEMISPRQVLAICAPLIPIAATYFLAHARKRGAMAEDNAVVGIFVALAVGWICLGFSGLPPAWKWPLFALYPVVMVPGMFFLAFMIVGITRLF